jgi:hypothetical protein
MTPDRAKILLAWMPFIQAVADGKKVQRLVCFGKWEDCDSAEIDNFLEEECTPDLKFWRIKPEPREFWVASLNDGTNYVARSLGKAKDIADQAKFSPNEIIHVREVLPE